jgi:hypothetical protein
MTVDRNAKQDSNRRRRNTRKMLSAVQQQLDAANGQQPAQLQPPQDRQKPPCACHAAPHAHAPPAEPLVERTVRSTIQAARQKPQNLVQPTVTPAVQARQQIHEETLVERVVTNQPGRQAKRQRMVVEKPTPHAMDTSDTEPDIEARTIAQQVLPRQQRNTIRKLESEWKKFTTGIFARLLIMCSFCGTTGWKDTTRFVTVPATGEYLPLLPLCPIHLPIAALANAATPLPDRCLSHCLPPTTCASCPHLQAHCPLQLRPSS